MDTLRQFTADSRPQMRDLKWSPSEKSIARKAFEKALQQELDTITQNVKQMALAIKTPSDLWKLEDYLTQSRKKIDDKYDYRYSVLPLVFGRLFREGHIKEEELRGLSEDKLAYIRLVGSYKDQTE
jgi:hypothetical protein